MTTVKWGPPAPSFPILISHASYVRREPVDILLPLCLGFFCHRMHYLILSAKWMQSVASQRTNYELRGSEKGKAVCEQGLADKQCSRVGVPA